MATTANALEKNVQEAGMRTGRYLRYPAKLIKDRAATGGFREEGDMFDGEASTEGAIPLRKTYEQLTM